MSVDHNHIISFSTSIISHTGRNRYHQLLITARHQALFQPPRISACTASPTFAPSNHVPFPLRYTMQFDHVIDQKLILGERRAIDSPLQFRDGRQRPRFLQLHSRTLPTRQSPKQQRSSDETLRRASHNLVHVLPCSQSSEGKNHNLEITRLLA